MKKTTTATTTKEATKTTTANKAKRTRKANNPATVKNNPTNKEDKEMKKTTTTTQGKTQKGNKGNKKNTQKSTPTNKGRVTNNKTQTAAERQKAAQEEEYNKLKEQATATANKAKETAREIRNTFKGAKKEVNEEHTPIYYMHLLNKMAEGKKEIKNVNASDLVKAYDMTATATPTVNGYKGFSFDVVKVNNNGDICRIVAYKPEPGDEERTAPNGATMVTTKKYQDVEKLILYTGAYLMIPVSINENGILSAVESYLQAYAAAVPDFFAFGKRYEAAKQKREAEKAAEKREAERRRAIREAEKAAQEAAVKAEEALKAAQADQQRTTFAAMESRRPWWRKLAVAMF